MYSNLLSVIAMSLNPETVTETKDAAATTTVARRGCYYSRAADIIPRQLNRLDLTRKVDPNLSQEGMSCQMTTSG